MKGGVSCQRPVNGMQEWAGLRACCCEACLHSEVLPLQPEEGARLRGSPRRLQAQQGRHQLLACVLHGTRVFHSSVAWLRSRQATLGISTAVA